MPLTHQRILTLDDQDYLVDKIIEQRGACVSIKLQDYVVSPHVVFSDVLSKPIVVKRNGKLIVIAKHEQTNILPGMDASLVSKYVLKKAKSDIIMVDTDLPVQHDRQSNRRNDSNSNRKNDYRNKAISATPFQVERPSSTERRFKTKHRRS